MYFEQEIDPLRLEIEDIGLRLERLDSNHQVLEEEFRDAVSSQGLQIESVEAKDLLRQQ